MVAFSTMQILFKPSELSCMEHFTATVKRAPAGVLAAKTRTQAVGATPLGPAPTQILTGCGDLGEAAPKWAATGPRDQCSHCRQSIAFTRRVS